jgi:peroxiredoxin
MAAVESTMLELGTKAPDFSLKDVITGKNVSLSDYKGNKAFLVMFICNHCPYVKNIKEGLVQYAADYLPRGVGIVAISSNDVDNYPDDSPENMKKDAEKFGYPFPYLFDESQKLQKTIKQHVLPISFCLMKI